MMSGNEFEFTHAFMPKDALFADGLDEILGDTEGIDLGFIGNVLDPLGLFKTGSAPPPGSPPGTPAPSGGGGLLGGLLGGGGGGGLLGNIVGGVGQALGLGGAGGPLGSLFGAGIGGTMPGTGPLPGQLGQMASQLFGQNGLPPINAALQQANPVDYRTIADHTEKAGRAIVRRILGGMNPPLNEIRRYLAQRRNQIQATAEHRQLNAASEAHREVLGFLGGIMQGQATRPGHAVWKA